MCIPLAARGKRPCFVCFPDKQGHGCEKHCTRYHFWYAHTSVPPQTADPDAEGLSWLWTATSRSSWLEAQERRTPGQQCKTFSCSLPATDVPDLGFLADWARILSLRTNLFISREEHSRSKARASGKSAEAVAFSGMQPHRNPPQPHSRREGEKSLSIWLRQRRQGDSWLSFYSFWQWNFQKATYPLRLFDKMHTLCIPLIRCGDEGWRKTAPVWAPVTLMVTAHSKHLRLFQIQSKVPALRSILCFHKLPISLLYLRVLWSHS